MRWLEATILSIVVCTSAVAGLRPAAAQPPEAPESSARESSDGAPAAEEDSAAGDGDGYSLDFLDGIDEGEEDAAIEETTPDDDDGPLELPLFGETTFSMTSTTIVQDRRSDLLRRGGLFDPEAGYGLSITEKLTLTMQGEELSVSTRFDAFVPILPPDCMGVGCELALDLRPGVVDDDRPAAPERFTIRWKRDDFALELGDSYAVIGRGMALSLRKVDLLGIDTTSRGAYVEYDGPHAYLRVLGGIANPQNLDPIDLSIVPDPWVDAMVGAEGGLRVGEDQDFEIGAHALRVWFEPDEVAEREVHASVFGWHVGAPSLADGALALYLEANAMVRRDIDPGLTQSRHWGRSVYGQAQINAGDLSLIFEWKDVRDYLLAPTNGAEAHRVYSAMPSLDRDTERFRGIHNSRGGSLQASYGLTPSAWVVGAQVFAYGHEDENRARDPWDGILTMHGLLQVTRQAQDTEADEVGWTLDMIAGYRREVYLTDEAAGGTREAGDVDWEVIHAEIDGAVAYAKHGFELRVEQRFERRQLFSQVDYVRGGATFTYTFDTFLTFSVPFLWTNEKETLPTFYPGIEGRWNFTEESFLRIFGGQTPGGRICSGGVCRDVPPFEGVLSELVLRL